MFKGQFIDVLGGGASINDNKKGRIPYAFHMPWHGVSAGYGKDSLCMYNVYCTRKGMRLQDYIKTRLG
jgi:hypothetical protein